MQREIEKSGKKMRCVGKMADLCKLPNTCFSMENMTKFTQRYSVIKNDPLFINYKSFLYNLVLSI